ncbi:MAG: CAAD domain-containing protein [Coleofasciculus sp. S288]|nr:CAAD domain-containing protein [Coleofasciculus sp. S288]
MSSEITTSTGTIEVKAEMTDIDLNPKDKLVVSQKQSTELSTESEWQQFGEKTSAFLNSLPSYVNDFFQKYQQILIIGGLILVVLTSVKVILAVLDAINDIPLLALILELVGLGYTIWFVYRYLLSAATRQELSEEIKALKAQVLGL